MISKDMARLSAMIELVQGLERDLGISDLSGQEKMVYMAVFEALEDSDAVSVSEFYGNKKLKGMSRTSFFRNLSSLCEQGYLKRIDAAGEHPKYKLSM